MACDCEQRGLRRGIEARGGGFYSMRGCQVNEPPLPVSDAPRDDLPAVAQLLSFAPSLRGARSPGSAAIREGGKWTVRSAFTLIHSHVYTPHAEMSEKVV